MLFIFFILLVVALGAIAGEIIGRLIRRRNLTDLKKSNLSLVEYDVIEDLSPAEFGYLIDARITRDEFVAEYIHMEQQGHINFVQEDGRVKFTRTLKTSSGRLTKVQQQIAGLMDARNPYGSMYLRGRSAMEEEVIRSLVSKGWINPPKRYRSVFQTASNRSFWTLCISFAFFFILFLISLGTIPQNSSDVADYAFFIAAGGLLLLYTTLIISWLFVLTFRRRFHLTNQIFDSATPKYQQNWQKLRGLALYLQVAGMDTMTPQYETLSYKDLDRLYPYAVAIGADPKVIKLLMAK